MSALHRCRIKCMQYLVCRHGRIVSRSQHSLAQFSDESDEPEYPAVKPQRPPGDWGDFHDKITWMWRDEQQEEEKLTSVKDKIAFTQKNFRTWLYKSLMYEPEHLQFQCSKTKTVLQTPDFTHGPSLVPSYGDHEGFPHVYKSMDVSAEVRILKPLLIQIIEMYDELYKGRSIVKTYSPWRKRIHTEESEHSKLLLKQMLLTIIGTLSCKYPHLQRVQLDEDVMVAAFWDRDGVKRIQPKPKYNRNYLQQNNSRFQGRHNVNFQLRSEDPLPEFRIIGSELFSREGMCQEYKFMPITVGLAYKSIKHEVTAGYHIGNPCQFNLLSIQLSNVVALQNIKEQYGATAYSIALAGYGLSTGFLSTVAQAYNQGFNTLRELVYPFTSQTIVTDGRDFLFQAYQLNTLHLWKDRLGNPVNNFCWGLAPCRLYEELEGGRVKGFNDNTLEQLLKFILLEPGDRGLDLKPFVDTSKDERVKKDPLPIAFDINKNILPEEKVVKRKFYTDMDPII